MWAFRFLQLFQEITGIFNFVSSSYILKVFQTYIYIYICVCVFVCVKFNTSLLHSAIMCKLMLLHVSALTVGLLQGAFFITCSFCYTYDWQRDYKTPGIWFQNLASFEERLKLRCLDATFITTANYSNCMLLLDWTAAIILRAVTFHRHDNFNHVWNFSDINCNMSCTC